MKNLIVALSLICLSKLSLAATPKEALALCFNDVRVEYDSKREDANEIKVSCIENSTHYVERTSCFTAFNWYLKMELNPWLTDANQWCLSIGRSFYRGPSGVNYFMERYPSFLAPVFND